MTTNNSDRRRVIVKPEDFQPWSVPIIAIQSDLPLQARMLYVALGARADNNTLQCWTSLPGLARDADMSVTSVKKYLPLLVNHGYIYVKSGQAKHRSNQYTLKRTAGVDTTSVSDDTTDPTTTGDDVELPERAATNASGWVTDDSYQPAKPKPPAPEPEPWGQPWGNMTPPEPLPASPATEDDAPEPPPTTAQPWGADITGATWDATDAMPASTTPATTANDDSDFKPWGWHTPDSGD